MLKKLVEVNKKDSEILSLNYKRVSNYNAMNDMHATAVKMIQKQEDVNKIIQKLKFYVNQDEEKAKRVFSDIYSK